MIDMSRETSVLSGLTSRGKPGQFHLASNVEMNKAKRNGRTAMKAIANHVKNTRVRVIVSRKRSYTAARPS
jgi:hypothetical protein